MSGWYLAQKCLTSFRGFSYEEWYKICWHSISTRCMYKFIRKSKMHRNEVQSVFFDNSSLCFFRFLFRGRKRDSLLVAQSFVVFFSCFSFSFFSSFNFSYYILFLPFFFNVNSCLSPLVASRKSHCSSQVLSRSKWERESERTFVTFIERESNFHQTWYICWPSYNYIRLTLVLHKLSFYSHFYFALLSSSLLWLSTMFFFLFFYINFRQSLQIKIVRKSSFENSPQFHFYSSIVSHKCVSFFRS